MTYVVGLTGGIGSGKSTVSAQFAKLGVPIIDADILAKEAVKPQSKAWRAIIKRFGKDVLQENGELNRRYLREIIFEYLHHRTWLERLLHPIIFKAIKLQLKKVKKPYCVVVIPLLAEHFKQYQSILDYIIVVDASQKIRLQRSHVRDKHHKKQIQKMMHTQASRQSRLKIADCVIKNNTNVSALKKHVLALHRTISSQLS